ncbi:Cof subfamily protein (haloacid dehalogenase superfamily) [Corynebacterium freneyi]|uniref:Cof subfamily protein (Haloacid dehalogenase superfamily) n=1 Tax=Corynebacterium freneyi TaxID=134034 RepID=A0ABS4U484_9CORY|nr:Cof subfamily protein (haloacid dehalogenase superfamily) [Corynebacterium freneyi]WJZ06415.1 Sugar phosphatase YidA [Corynebacterium freneyi]
MTTEVPRGSDAAAAAGGEGRSYGTGELPPLLVASDIDGTLLDSRDRVSPRLKRAIGRMIRRGVPLTLATGRPARWLQPVLEQLPVRPVCVCGNGAVLYDSGRDVVLADHSLAPEVQAEVVAIARSAMADIGPVGVAVERAGRSALDPSDELFVVGPAYAHAWESTEHGICGETEMMSEPATKMLLSNPGMASAELHSIIAPHIPADLAHVTYSMPEGLIEVSAPGVTKRAGLEELAGLVGAGASDVVCFGDMPNDIEMIRWAGLGVAMGNSVPEVQRAADEVTATNDDDGVARVLERWF